MVRKTIFLFIFFTGFIYQTAFTQQCSESYLLSGQNDYNAGNYKKAKEYFETGLKCIGTSEAQKNLLKDWIIKCDKANKPVIKSNANAEENKVNTIAKRSSATGDNDKHAGSSKAILLLISDIDCTISIDGDKFMEKKANKPLKISVDLGEHIITSRTTDEKDSVSQTISVTDNTQKIISLDIATARNERLALEQKAIEKNSVEQKEKDEKQRIEQKNSEAKKATENILSSIISDNDEAAEEKIKTYILQGGNINIKVAQGGENGEPGGYNTPLRLAIEKNYIKVIQLLISQGAEIDEKNNTGETPLISAVSNFGNIDIREQVELLIKAGADIEAADNRGFTPLCAAVVYRPSDFGLVILLLNNHAIINTNDKYGRTPLKLTSSPEMKKLLLSRGAR